MLPSIVQGAQLAYAGAAVAAANDTDANSTRIDTKGFEGVVFFTTITDSVDTGVAALTLEQNDADSDTGMSALTGAVASATSAANDDLNGTVLVAEVIRPTKRWVQAVRTSATANIAFGEVYAILIGPRAMPVDDHATIAEAVTVTSPAES